MEGGVGIRPPPVAIFSSHERMRTLLFLLFFFFQIFPITFGVVCFDCRADDSTCDVGQCHGMVCLKMETSNMDNERRAVHKSCGDEIEPTQCRQSGFGSKLITRCSCDTDFCNGDDRLDAAGLLMSSSGRSFPLVGLFCISFLFLFQ